MLLNWVGAALQAIKRDLSRLSSNRSPLFNYPMAIELEYYPEYLSTRTIKYLWTGSGGKQQRIPQDRLHYSLQNDECIVPATRSVVYRFVSLSEAVR